MLGIDISSPGCKLTVMRLESQYPVESAWGLDSGLPGKTAFMLPVGSSVRPHFELNETELVSVAATTAPIPESGKGGKRRRG